MAAYALLASYSTVQVLSSQVVNDVVYCTIQTNPSQAIASLPVSRTAFDQNQAVEELTAFANNIETLIGRGHVTTAAGVQSIDPSGLLQDVVQFTVEYVPAGASTSSITATADVPANMLSVSDPAIDRVLLAEAEAIIDAVYASLQSAASG